MPAIIWRWWTSNSVKRLTAHDARTGRYEQDGDVLHAYVARDGHADICVSPAAMAMIEAAPDMYAALKGLVPDEVRATISKNHAADCRCNYCVAIMALNKAERKAVS